MAYFSNGTEGEVYRERFCDRCLYDERDGGCPIWFAHLAYCHDEHGKPGGAILDLLIPMLPHTFSDGITYKIAGECRFFTRSMP